MPLPINLRILVRERKFGGQEAELKWRMETKPNKLVSHLVLDIWLL